MTVQEVLLKAGADPEDLMQELRSLIQPHLTRRRT